MSILFTLSEYTRHWEVNFGFRMQVMERGTGETLKHELFEVIVVNPTKQPFEGCHKSSQLGVSRVYPVCCTPKPDTCGWPIFFVYHVDLFTNGSNSSMNSGCFCFRLRARAARIHPSGHRRCSILFMLL